MRETGRSVYLPVCIHAHSRGGNNKDFTKNHVLALISWGNEYRDLLHILAKNLTQGVKNGETAKGPSFCDLSGF